MNGSLARMARIHQLICAGKRATARAVAREFGVTAWAVQDDVIFMRERLGVPVSYDRKALSYVYGDAPAEFFAILNRAVLLLKPSATFTTTYTSNCPKAL